jgi:hypothetical protein
MKTLLSLRAWCVISSVAITLAWLSFGTLRRTLSQRKVPQTEEVIPIQALTTDVEQSYGRETRIDAKPAEDQNSNRQCVLRISDASVVPQSQAYSDWRCAIRLSQVGSADGSQNGSPIIPYEDVELTAFDDQGNPMAVAKDQEAMSSWMWTVQNPYALWVTAFGYYRLYPTKGRVPGRIDLSMKGERQTFTFVKDEHPEPLSPFASHPVDTAGNKHKDR